MRLGALIGACFLLSGSPLLGQVLPFFTNTALTVGFESNGVRTFSRFVARNRLETDGTEVADPDDRDAFVFAQVFAVPVRLGRGTVLTISAPVLRKELEFNRSNGTRAKLSDGGLGDFTVSVKHRFYQHDYLGGGFQAAVIGGIKLPSGDHNQRDAQGDLLPRSLQLGTGSVDVPLGMVFTAFKGRIGFNTDFIHRFNNESDGFRFGDESRFDAAVGYRILPAKYGSFRDKVVTAYLEYNLIVSQRAASNGREVAGSGGTVSFVTPGVQVVLSPRFLVEAAFQLPVAQNLNGTQLAFSPTANFGIRLLF